MAGLESIILKDKPLSELVKETVSASVPKSTVNIENDAGFITANEKVNSAVKATNTLALSTASGVSAGTYGPSADVAIGSTDRKSVVIPQFTVNANGIITSAVNRTYTVGNSCSNCSDCSHCSRCSVTSGCSECSNCSHHTCTYNCGDVCSQSP